MQRRANGPHRGGHGQDQPGHQRGREEHRRPRQVLRPLRAPLAPPEAFRRGRRRRAQHVEEARRRWRAARRRPAHRHLRRPPVQRERSVALLSVVLCYPTALLLSLSLLVALISSLGSMIGHLEL